MRVQFGISSDSELLYWNLINLIKLEIPNYQVQEWNNDEICLVNSSRDGIEWKSSLLNPVIDLIIN